MKKLLLLFFLLCLPYKAFAGFVDAINCDDIPLAQRNTNALICLQSTTAGGRSPGIGYLWNGTVWIQYSNIPRVAVAALPAVPKTGDVVVVTDALNSATCAVAGGIAANICQWTGAAWSPIGGGGGSSGHLFKDETLDLANQPLTYINCTGGGIACTSNVGTNSVDITVTAGAEADPVVGAITGVVKGDGAGNIAAANATDLPYTPAGDIAANTVGGAIAELDKEKQPLDADLTAIAGNVTAGFWAAGTNVARSFANGTGITWTNPAGIAGNPQASVDSTVARSGAAWTAGNFDYDFGGAASLGFPRATGAAPTTPGRCAYDSTNTPGVYRCGFNGTTLTLATTNLTQPLNAILTGLSALTGPGTEARIPYIDSTGVWHYFQKVLCVNSGGNVPHTSNLAPLTETCDASATSGLSGATNNQALFATAATTFASSNALTKTAGGVIQMPNGIEVGNISTDSWEPDATAYVGQGHIPIVLPYVGAVPSFVLSTGAKTNGNIVKWNASGAAVDGGAAGTGDVTLADVQTLDNKTIKAVGSASPNNTNTIVLPLVASFDGGGVTPDGTNCQDPVKVQINSGPREYAVLCSTAASALWGVKVPMLKAALTTLVIRIEVNDSVSSSHVYAGTVKAMCRRSGDTVDSTWGTTQTVAATMVTASITYQAASAAVTPNGTCSADASLYVQFDASGSMTDAGTARLIGVRIYQAS